MRKQESSVGKECLELFSDGALAIGSFQIAGLSAY